MKDSIDHVPNGGNEREVRPKIDSCCFPFCFTVKSSPILKNLLVLIWIGVRV